MTTIPRRKAVLLGGTGIIATALAELLVDDWDVVRVARHSGDLRCDTDSPEAVAELFAAVGMFDALVITIGGSVHGLVASLPVEAFAAVFRDKLLRQVWLLQAALPTLRPGGSITLTAGVLSSEPVPGFAAAAVANGAVAALTRAAARELAATVRVNCVSPVFVTESATAAGKRLPPELPQMPAADTARAYLYAIESSVSGLDIDPRLPFDAGAAL